MILRTGNGGWHRIEGAEGIPGRLYVRIQEVDGLLRITELYVDGQGEPISAAGLRGLPLQMLEQWAADAPAARQRLQTPGPDLSRLAAFFSTTFGAKVKHWVADAYRAQFPQSGVPRPAEPASSAPKVARPPEVQIGAPPGGRLTDEWLSDLARAYRAAVARRQPPARAIAEALGPGTSVRTVQGWIAKARDRGHLEPAARTGRIV